MNSSSVTYPGLTLPKTPPKNLKPPYLSPPLSDKDHGKRPSLDKATKLVSNPELEEPLVEENQIVELKATKKTLAKQAAEDKKKKKANIEDDDIDNFEIENVPFWEYVGKVNRFLPGSSGYLKQQQTMDTKTACRILAKRFMVNGKTKDLAKLFPRQERLELIIMECENPGTTSAPAGINPASWKYDIGRNFQYSRDYSITGSTGGRKFLQRHPYTLYEVLSDAEIKRIENHLVKNGLEDGQLANYPEYIAVETFYQIFVDYHVDDNLETHHGRDKTDSRIRVNISHNFNKELIADLINACPTCQKAKANKI